MSDLPRPMMKDDVDPLAALWHDAWHRSHDQLVPRDICDFRDEGYFRRRLEKEHDSVRVLGQPGNPTGLCIQHGANLDMLFIALNEQGGGLGEQLLSDAESRMRGSGLEEAYLHVALGNDGAVRFYRRHNWIYIGAEEKVMEIGGGTITLQVGRMIKRL
jgi:ribosomal protein S18 acetylase RimI-like enzyme